MRASAGSQPPPRRAFPVWPRSEGGTGVYAIAVIAALSQLFQPLAHGLTEHIGAVLESRIEPGHLPQSHSLAGIIVLGGSTTRVEAALRLAERYPHTAVLLSGPGDDEVALAKARIKQGDRLIIDRRATNTYENALYSRQFMSGRNRAVWAVVTSAVHMPRAVASFDAIGARQEVLPWPVYDTSPDPQDKSAAVWHEVFGLAWYWALGRTRLLFPSNV